MSKTEIDDVPYTPQPQNAAIKIVVLGRGYVYIGRVCCEEDKNIFIIHNARCLIQWGTTAHLGQLVDGPLENTKLGDRCTVLSLLNKVEHFIEVNQNAWAEHIN